MLARVLEKVQFSKQKAQEASRFWNNKQVDEDACSGSECITRVLEAVLKARGPQRCSVQGRKQALFKNQHKHLSLTNHLKTPL